jgi:hypothetical protein
VELPDPETGINAAVDRHGINVAETLTREQAEAMFSGRGYPVTANA